MFVLPSIAAGLLVAIAIGGRPSRLLELRFRGSALVLGSLALQLVLFSRLGHGIPQPVADVLHLGSYALLVLFGALNVRVRALWVLLAGLLLNAAAILANGGVMPLSGDAAAAAGIGGGANVDAHARRLAALGDVFAIPNELPFANA